MRAGLLRHRITIQERTAAEWVDFAKAWAAKEQLTGQENFELSDQLLQDREIVRFRIRYRTGITHKMRVRWDDQAFDIQRIEELDNHRREMGLLCLEVPYDGD
jgi:SPP1 family predicted phage head-tail adaptor